MSKPRIHPLVKLVEESAARGTEFHKRDPEGLPEPQTTTLRRLWTAACWAGYSASIEQSDVAQTRWLKVERAWRAIFYCAALEDPSEHDDLENARPNDSEGQLSRLEESAALGSSDPLDAEVIAVLRVWLAELR